ncbi:hypothetical protein ACH3XW_34635 [Acanthocheilonema viteae]
MKNNHMTALYKKMLQTNNNKTSKTVINEKRNETLNLNRRLCIYLVCDIVTATNKVKPEKEFRMRKKKGYRRKSDARLEISSELTFWCDLRGKTFGTFIVVKINISSSAIKVSRLSMI